MRPRKKNNGGIWQPTTPSVDVGNSSWWTRKPNRQMCSLTVADQIRRPADRDLLLRQPLSYRIISFNTSSESWPVGFCVANNPCQNAHENKGSFHVTSSKTCLHDNVVRNLMRNASRLISSRVVSSAFGTSHVPPRWNPDGMKKRP